MSDSGWGAVIAGLATIYSTKQKKDAAEDQYKAQEAERERRNQYNQEKYEASQNTPQSKMQKYMLAYYLPQMVENMKGRNKGGDTSMLDKMLQDIMGGLDLDGSSGGSASDSPFSASSMSQVGGSRRAGVNMQDREAARKAGDYEMVMGKINPELEGYNGKTWESKSQPLTLDGTPTGGLSGAWGVSASQVGGQRESTRNMGSTTTQTERGYDNPVLAGGPGLQVSQQDPIQYGDLATGGEITHLGGGAEMTFTMPDNIFKGLGTAALKAGATMVIPGFGPVRYLGGKLFQKFGTNQSPGRQTFLETFFGIDDNSYGHLMKQKNKPTQVAYNAPVGRGV